MNMKTTLKYIALSMSAALMAACSPDYITPDQAKLPQAADFDVQVEVNQETNYVTFNMNNNGIVPVWIVGATDPIDNANGSKVTGKNSPTPGTDSCSVSVTRASTPSRSRPTTPTESRSARRWWSSL